jgi:glycosyltransferase involved in cell wall biosynthesis
MEREFLKVFSSKSVAVIIPTYNRAHLLERVLPTYVQPGVEQIIVVNDASTDNTELVLKALSTRIPILEFITNDRNRKQMFSKNRGVALAKTKYIYFGDDDSFILPGTIEALVSTINHTGVDVVGCRALYMREGETLQNLFIRCNQHATISDDLFDLKTFRHEFHKVVDDPIRVLTFQACFLIESDLARSHSFFEYFIGPAQREESDYLIRLSARGYRLAYTSAGCQINLPRSEATGGSWGNPLYRELSLLVNILIFSIRNYTYLKNTAGPFFVVRHIAYVMRSKIRVLVGMILGV